MEMDNSNKEFGNIRFFLGFSLFLCLIIYGWGMCSAFEGDTEYVDFISGNVTYVSSPHHIMIPHTNLPPIILTNPLDDESGISPGVIIYGRAPKNGLNIIRLDNTKNNRDIIFGIQKPKWPNPEFAVLVPGGASITIRDIPDGTYDAFLATGSGWENSKKVFLVEPDYYIISDPLSLETSDEEKKNGNRITYKRMYTVYSYDLHKLLEENVLLSRLHAEDFLKLTPFS